VAANKPITIGHQYSVAVYLPEKLSPQSPPWVVPLSSKRVSTKDNNTQVGMKQMSTLIQTGRPFKEQLCVLVADSAYSTPDCLCEVSKNENQVHISRLRNNRSLPRALSEKKPGRGRPRKYGNPFKLGDKRTWGKPTQTEQFTNTNKKGKIQNIKIDHWEDITLRTPYKIEAFRIVRIGVFKSNGDRLFKCPLWLLIAGKRRNELTLRDIFESYRQRFDIEHFFRLGKTRLLLDKFQTPEVVHEEAWWQLAMIAYTELYLARQIVHDVSTPWGKYLPEFKSPREESSPSQVQKCFDGIIREFGTPAKAPKPRNKSEGRHQGEIQKKRPRYKVVFKEQKNHVFSSD
jgi:hypothetical protein